MGFPFLRQQSTTITSIEVELLLECVKSQIKHDSTQQIQKLLHNSINWDSFLDLTYRHAIAPLIYWQLREDSLDQVPHHVLEELRHEFNLNARKQFVFTGELLRLNALFRQSEIPAIFFKGPVLSSIGYNNPLCREFVDLDILVPKSFLRQTRELLLAQCYRPAYEINQNQVEIFWKINNEEAFVSDDQQIIIDLHWSLISENFSFSPDHQWIWGCKDIFYLKNTPIQTLSNECLLLFLCTHGAKHSWSELKLICDLAGLIQRHPDLKWDWIISHQNQLGTQKMLFLGLYLCHHLLEIDLPTEILTQVAENLKIKSISKIVEDNLFDIHSKRKYLFGINKIYLQTMNTWQDQMRRIIFMHMNPTALELNLVSVPNWLFPIYYVIRPIRLLVKYIKIFCKLA